MRERNEDPLEVDDDARVAAHKALDRWIDQAQVEGNKAFDDGRAGYIGRLKICAFVNDDEVALRIERGFTDPL